MLHVVQGSPKRDTVELCVYDENAKLSGAFGCCQGLCPHVAPPQATSLGPVVAWQASQAGAASDRDSCSDQIL